jgi:hypothetical protein
MRVLFHCTCMTTPHFEAEMEMMQDHLEKGDEVFALACDGQLPTCFTNPDHLKSRCIACQGKFHSGITIIGEGVKVVQYPFKAQSSYFEIPSTFDNIEALKKFRIGPLHLGICTASTLISRLNREHKLDTILHAKTISRELRTAYYLYHATLELIKDIRPDRVYLFNGRFTSSLPVINACETLKIPFFTHDRGGRLDSYSVMENATPHNIEFATRDIQRFWIEHSEEEAISGGSAFFEDRRKRVEHSWVSYTKAQELGILPQDFDPKKRNFVFFNTTIEEYASVRERPKQLFFYEDECDAMEQIANSFRDDPNVHFYLRVHPNQRGSENSQSRDIANLGNRVPNFTIIPPDSKIDSYALMEAATAVVTFGSTMGAESCYWGKPNILLGHAYYEAFQCSHVPKDHAEVVELLKAELEPNARLGSIQYGFWEAQRGIKFRHFIPGGLFNGTYDGNKVRSPLLTRLWMFFNEILECRSPSELRNLFMNVSKR